MSLQSVVEAQKQPTSNARKQRRIIHLPLRKVVWTAIRNLRRRRVPVIMQMNGVECGAACLAMILSYYGRNTDVAECRQSLSVGRDGVTAQTITREARRFGLRVKAYSLQGELETLRHVSLPAIVHWDFNHFVVLERWTPRWVEIIDPAQGRRRLEISEFAAKFTGVLLTMEPGVHFERRNQAIHASWRTYLQHLLALPNAARLLTQVLLASLFLQALGLILPLFTKIVVDRVIPLAITNIWWLLGIGMALLVLTQTITVHLRSLLLLYLQARLDSQMMLGFFEHLLSLPFRFFQERSTGDLMMRLSSNATIRETLTGQTISILLDGLFVLVYLAILLAADALFGGLVVAIGLLQVLIIRSSVPRLQGLIQRDLAAQSEAQSYLVEVLNGVSTLKASGAEERVFERWSNLFFKQLNLSLQRQNISLLVETVMSALRTATPFLLLWVGTQRVLAGVLSTGDMLALNAMAIAFLTPVVSLANSIQRLQIVRAHLDRLADVMEAEPEQQLEAVQLAPPLSGHISLRNVNFRYNADAPYVLRNIDLTIQPGQKVAIVGRTGSGKSTLGRLLLGLYPTSEGELLFDGIPLTTLNYRSLRTQFGVVTQEPFLFNTSIRENISLQSPDLPLSEVLRAAQLAGIHKEILQMPMGYETRVAEGGSGLSGGQRQRLALARAVAHKPAILLLDEATSHLDVLTEQRVDAHLNQLACTRIVIAHRLSTIRNADLIVVLEEGAMIERGTHTELLAQDGFYASLVRSQVERTDTLATPASGFPR